MNSSQRTVHSAPEKRRFEFFESKDLNAQGAAKALQVNLNGWNREVKLACFIKNSKTAYENFTLGMIIIRTLSFIQITFVHTLC